MVLPRFLFTTAISTETLVSQERPSGWRSSHDDAPNQAVAWRLVGANNRELGRSIDVFPTFAACHAATVALQKSTSGAAPVVAFDELTGRWGWQLDVDGEPVAMSAREYWRQRECEYNAHQFMGALPIAVAADAVIVRSRVRPLNRPDLEIPDPRRAEDSTGANDPTNLVTATTEADAS